MPPAPRQQRKKATGRPDERAAAWITDEPLMTYQDWVELHFDPGERGNPGISGMQAAPHGDGLPNLVKFALGLGAGPAPASELPRVELADGNLFMTYRKLSETSGCRILVEAADSPSGPWSELRNAATVRAADGSVTVKVADEVGVAAKKNRFLRLKVVAD
jgi:hypothetical protein